MVSIERSALELAILNIWIYCLRFAVDLACMPAAISTVPATFFDVVFSVACAIASPHTNAFEFFTLHVLFWNNLGQDFPSVISVVYDRWLWKHVIWKHLRVRSPIVAVGRGYESGDCEID